MATETSNPRLAAWAKTSACEKGLRSVTFNLPDEGLLLLELKLMKKHWP